MSKIPIYIIPTAMLCAALVPMAAWANDVPSLGEDNVNEPAAAATSPQKGGGDKPVESGSSSSSEFEYIDLTIKAKDGTVLKTFHDQGANGADGWLIQGTYATPTFTFSGNQLNYAIGKQSGSISFTLPEGYEVNSYNPVWKISDASVNSSSSQFDCCIATITIDTIVNSSGGDPIEYVYYNATVKYKDIDTGEEIANAVRLPEYKLAGSAYDLTQHDQKVIEGYDYVYTDGVLAGTMTGNVDITVYYRASVVEEEDPIEKEYAVSYEWTGDIPDGVELPESQKYEEGATVGVDSTYTDKTIIEAEDGKYVFSGWDMSDTFVLEKDTVIKGEWTFVPNEVVSDNPPFVEEPDEGDVPNGDDGEEPSDEGEESEDGDSAVQEKKADTVIPQTGDNTPVALGLLGMILAALGAAASRFKMSQN